MQPQGEGGLVLKSEAVDQIEIDLVVGRKDRLHILVSLPRIELLALHCEDTRPICNP